MKQLLFSVTKNDFEIETFSVGGAGGGGKDTSNSGVRLRHRASGAVGEGREHRSNTQNRRAAFERLVASERFQKWHKMECARRMGGAVATEEKVRLDAGFGANKIRTYHYPDQRVTDHRLGKQYPLDRVMAGGVGRIIHDLIVSRSGQS